MLRCARALRARPPPARARRGDRPPRAGPPSVRQCAAHRPTIYCAACCDAQSSCDVHRCCAACAARRPGRNGDPPLARHERRAGAELDRLAAALQRLAEANTAWSPPSRAATTRPWPTTLDARAGASRAARRTSCRCTRPARRDMLAQRGLVRAAVAGHGRMRASAAAGYLRADRGALLRRRGPPARAAVQRRDAGALLQPRCLPQRQARPGKPPKTWYEMPETLARAGGVGLRLRAHHRLAVVGAAREHERLARPALRHAAQRHGRAATRASRSTPG